MADVIALAHRMVTVNEKLYFCIMLPKDNVEGGDSPQSKKSVEAITLVRLRLYILSVNHPCNASASVVTFGHFEMQHVAWCVLQVSTKLVQWALMISLTYVDKRSLF